MIEPLLWRPFGWCRLEVDVAGKQKREGEGAAEGKQLRAVLPVGSRALALDLVARILPGTPTERLRPPRRARWKSPLRYRNLSWGRNDDYVVTTSGRIRRVTAWVPLEKVQSLRRVEGPVQRRLRLATIHARHGRPQRPREPPRPRPRRGRRGARRADRPRARRAAGGVAQRVDADQHAAGDDEQRAGREPQPDALARAEHERREADAPEALGRDERRDDRDRPVEVRLEEAEVREPEEDAGRRERAQLAPARRASRPGGARRSPRRSASRPRRSPGSRARAARGRGCRAPRSRPSRRPRRAGRRAGGDPGLSRSPASAMPPPTIASAPSTSGSSSGSSRKTSASATASSGAVADRDRRPRRAGLADREREEDLRAARRDQPGEEERPGVMEVVARHGRDDRERDGGQQRRERPGRRRAGAQPDPDRHRHRAEERRRGEREQDRRHAVRGRRTRRASTSAAAGSARTMPAMITAQPAQPSAPSRSPASVKPKSAAHTGSSVKTSAVRFALVRRCAQVCTRNASALANTPVTSSAPHTVQPCGTSSGRERRDREHRERREHHQQREPERVVARREALHQQDLQRVDRGAREHEQVADRRAAGHARDQREPGRREHDAEPDAARRPAAGRARGRAAA